MGVTHAQCTIVKCAGQKCWTDTLLCNQTATHFSSCNSEVGLCVHETLHQFPSPSEWSKIHTLDTVPIRQWFLIFHCPFPGSHCTAFCFYVFLHPGHLIKAESYTICPLPPAYFTLLAVLRLIHIVACIRMSFQRLKNDPLYTLIYISCCFSIHIL